MKFQPIRKHNLTSSHFEHPNDTKIINNVVDHQSNMSAMFDSNLFQCLISEKKIKCENLMNANGDGREVIEIFCMDLWSM